MTGSHRLRSAGVSLCIVALAVTALGTAPGRAGNVQTAGWKQLEPPGVPAAPPPLTSIQCPSVTVCYAFGTSPETAPSGTTSAVFQKTTDGGATWTFRQLDTARLPDPFEQTPLACPATTVCFLAVDTGSLTQMAGAVLATTDGGQTWSKRTLGGDEQPEQIACPSTTVCYVIAFVQGQQAINDLWTTGDGGATWTSHPLTVANQSVTALACPTVATCYLSGAEQAAGVGPAGGPGIAVTHDGGQSWTIGLGESSQPADYSDLNCVSAVQCYAVTWMGAIAETDDGGLTWTTRNTVIGDTGYPTRIACPTPQICDAAAGSGLWQTEDGGLTWVQEQAGTNNTLDDITCPGPTTCYAVGNEGAVVKTVDGKTWGEPTPYTRDSLNAISCPSVATCYAPNGAGAVLTTTDGGATWISRPGPSTGYVSGLVCPGIRVCYASSVDFSSGSSSTLMKTVDGGRTWHAEGLSLSGEVIAAIACPTRSVCYAASYTTPSPVPSLGVVFRISANGAHWTRQELPNSAILQSIACPTAKSCVAVGGVSSCPGSLLRARQMTGASGLQARPGQSECQDEGWLLVTTDGGKHWKRRFHRKLFPAETAGADLDSVSCPSPTQCYAAGSGIWLRGSPGGKHWSVTTQNTVFDHITSVSCPGTATCWGLGWLINDWTGDPLRTTNGGRTWNVIAGNVPVPEADPSSGGLVTLTCPSTTTCFAAGRAGLIMRYSP